MTTQKYKDLVMVIGAPAHGLYSIEMRADPGSPLVARGPSVSKICALDILDRYRRVNNACWQCHNECTIRITATELFTVPGYPVELACALVNRLREPYHKVIDIPSNFMYGEMPLDLDWEELFTLTHHRYLGTVIVLKEPLGYHMTGSRDRLLTQAFDWIQAKMGEPYAPAQPVAKTCGHCEHYNFLELSCRKNRDLKNLEPLHECRLEAK